MRASARLVIAVTVAALGGLTVLAFTAGVPVSTKGGLTRAKADETLRAHNAWRQRAGVVPLRWAADLANRAQARAEELAAHGCVIKHGRLPQDIGENLYQAGPVHGGGRPNELFAATPTHVVDMWGVESADYSPERGTCARNRECGHYTQMVWAATREVGCGMSVCPSLGQVWVCNYRPRGNIRTIR